MAESIYGIDFVARELAVHDHGQSARAQRENSSAIHKLPADYPI
jgi:hypothetical protein